MLRIKYTSRQAIRVFIAGLIIMFMPASASLAAESPHNNFCAACNAFNSLNSRIRDGGIYKGAAEELVEKLIPKIRDHYFKSGGVKYDKGAWVFPVEGYSATMPDVIYKHDYQPKNYNYYDGNNHGGHPSYDIFIRDKNHDELDDLTGRHVNILSMTGGIVIAAENEWKTDSKLRGGKFVWIYDPSTESLIYYAHNREILVNVGHIVKPGERIAVMGRTGLNAYKKRSPTHLHITFLKTDGGKMRAQNIYNDLKKARTEGRSAGK